MHQIQVSDGCQIAEYVQMSDQANAAILVERNVWLAARVEVKGGCHIGEHCVVGAHALVTGNLERCSLYLGRPASLQRKALDFTSPSNWP